MSRRKHKKIDRFFKDDFINEKSLNAHKDIVEKIDKEKEILRKEIAKRKDSNNNEFSELAKGLIFQLGNFEVQT